MSNHDVSARLWKVQRPLYHSGPDPYYLAYDEHQEEQAAIPIPDTAVDDLFERHGNPPKVYVWAEVKGGRFLFHPEDIEQEAAW